MYTVHIFTHFSLYSIIYVKKTINQSNDASQVGPGAVDSAPGYCLKQIHLEMGVWRWVLLAPGKYVVGEVHELW